MTVLDVLAERNADFAAHRFSPDLRINPSRKTMLIGCVDPRVEPSEVRGRSAWPMAAVRGEGWNLVVLHRTDCGMTDLAAFPDRLAQYFGIPVGQLPAGAVSDPEASVRLDVDVLRQTPYLPARFLVSGLVYDVTTGLVKTVVAPAPLRDV